MGKLNDIRKNDLLLISTERKLGRNENIKHTDLLNSSDMVLAFVE
jgi:hypothetical protein